MSSNSISEIYSEAEIQANGLTISEYQKIIEILGREPNVTELGIFSVMWSEHCSYKSTRYHLRKLHTKEDFVICGPGENAGVIDIEDGDAIIFKMESHNHPSFIEPYQGAATGVGGIMRDVFTMGARPIAVLDSLRFGQFDHPKTKYLLDGVVAGIGGYGNCVGVPNIAGDVIFHESFNGNILVNAMCVGLARTDKIFYSAASEIGSKVLYVGAKTGRDGIHGATMASTEFDDESEEKRPTVQVGDPFKEKLLIEACLELMQHDVIIAIQDMGAAGLTSSSLEMAAKGGAGIELDLDKVPCREKNMTPYEMMLSESQERMLMVVKPEKEDVAHEIFKKWDLDSALIGSVTDSKHLVLRFKGEIAADIPVSPLADNAPLYQREYIEPKIAGEYQGDLKLTNKVIDNLKVIIAAPDLAEKSYICNQYDAQVMNDTVSAHKIGAGIVRIRDTEKAVIATTKCTPRYVYNNPELGAIQAVLATYRNITACGGTPLAITNCLNFGNPEKPEIMGQIVKSIEGIAKASKELSYPVISGNVSLYNETNGKAIQPTPNIGGVGLIKDYKKHIKNYWQEADSEVYVIGETTGHLGASLYLREICNSELGAVPNIDFAKEKKIANLILELNQANLILSCKDVGSGGILPSFVKLSLFANIGAEFILENFPQNLSLNQFLFAEDQARYLVEVKTENNAKFIDLLEAQQIKFNKIAKLSSQNNIKLGGEEISLSELKQLNLVF